MQHSEETKNKISASKKGKSISSKGRISWKKGLHVKVMPSKNCKICDILFFKKPSRSYLEWNSSSCCSMKCRNKLLSSIRIGIKLSDKWRENLRKSHLGISPPNKGKRTLVKCLECKVDFYPKKRNVTAAKYCSLKCFNKTANKMPRPNSSGENHHNWKDGITPVNEKIRKSIHYKKWRHDVFTRDNYTCQHCKQRGGKLNADHILPFSLYPELRFELSNGRTLCVDCHKQIGWSLFKMNNPRKRVNTEN